VAAFWLPVLGTLAGLAMLPADTRILLTHEPAAGTNVGLAKADDTAASSFTMI
jgi:hypothetical protein